MLVMAVEELGVMVVGTEGGTLEVTTVAIMATTTEGTNRVTGRGRTPLSRPRAHRFRLGGVACWLTSLASCPAWAAQGC